MFARPARWAWRGSGALSFSHSTAMAICGRCSPLNNKIGDQRYPLRSWRRRLAGSATIRDLSFMRWAVHARSLLVEQLAGNPALIGRPFRPDDEGQVTISTPSPSQRPYFPMARQGMAGAGFSHRVPATLRRCFRRANCKTQRQREPRLRTNRNPCCPHWDATANPSSVILAPTRSGGSSATGRIWRPGSIRFFAEALAPNP